MRGNCCLKAKGGLDASRPSSEEALYRSSDTQRRWRTGMAAHKSLSAFSPKALALALGCPRARLVRRGRRAQRVSCCTGRARGARGASCGRLL